MLNYILKRNTRNLYPFQKAVSIYHNYYFVVTIKASEFKNLHDPMR